MVLIIFAIGIALTILGVRLVHKSYDYEGAGYGIGTVGAIVSIMAAIAICVLLSQVVALPTLQDKIDMYTEENAKIESQVDTTVKAYMEHENEIFTNTTPESSMTLISLYPELKSDALVQKQLEVYTANNQIIKDLKTQQIDGRVAKWWLYFGG